MLGSASVIRVESSGEELASAHTLRAPKSKDFALLATQEQQQLQAPENKKGDREESGWKKWKRNNVYVFSLFTIRDRKFLLFLRKCLVHPRTCILSSSIPLFASSKANLEGNTDCPERLIHQHEAGLGVDCFHHLTVQEGVSDGQAFVPRCRRGSCHRTG